LKVIPRSLAAATYRRLSCKRLRTGAGRIVDDITLTVELRSGARLYLVPRECYAAMIAQTAERWAAIGGKSAYVPALSHGDTGCGEYDGFGVFANLMERREALWKHPLVRTIAD
jgi:hypothetical protein